MQYVASVGRAFRVMKDASTLGGAFVLGSLAAGLPAIDARMSVRGLLTRAAIAWLPTVSTLLNG